MRRESGTCITITFRYSRPVIPALFTALLLVACGRSEDSGQLEPGTRQTQAASPSGHLDGADYANQGDGADPQFMRPVGATREIDFTTDEGTWLSIDVSPDGSWLVFDMLGHIYSLPISGGEAVCLTQGSGVAINYHPRISPDGNTIAFISDRSGQENLWAMNADGSQPRPVLLDEKTRVRSPAWAPDGTAIIAERHFRTRNGFHNLDAEIWQFPLSGGEPKVLAEAKAAALRWPTVSPDGNTLMYFTSFPTWNVIGAHEGFYIQRKDLASGALSYLRGHQDRPLDPDSNPETSEDVTHGRVARIPQLGFAELSPEISPDGRQVAFGMQMKDETLTWRGHEYGPTTALWLRNLDTGEERVLVDQISVDLSRINVNYTYRVLPGYDWLPDSSAIVFAQGGKIRRVDVASGAIDTIHFTARVHRIASQQSRSAIELNDETFAVKFIQWPAGSPDGNSVVFVAAGQLWITSLAGGTPRRLAAGIDGIPLTPSWAPNGSRIAFAVWREGSGSSIVTILPDGSGGRVVGATRGLFAHPVFSPDGEMLAAIERPGQLAPEEWSRTLGDSQWQLISLPVEGGNQRVVGQAGGFTAPHFGPDGRVFFSEDNVDEANEYLVSINPFANPTQELAGNEIRRHATFPVRWRYLMDLRNEPAVSPDGTRVAFHAARNIYVNPLPRADGEALPEIANNQNESAAGRTRVGNRGGVYHRWRDNSTLEFASGNFYISYDASSNTLTEFRIDLELPRAARGDGSIAFSNARIVSLAADGVIEAGDVVVSDGRIRCVGECDLDAGTKIIDASGKTIVPGFIDVHAHQTSGNGPVPGTYVPALAASLAYGVTTIVDPATLSHMVFPRAEMTEAGLMRGPRIFTTAEHAYGWGDRIDLKTEADAELMAGRRVAWGAVSLKNYRMNRRRQQQMFIEAARRHNTTVTSEGGSLHNNVGKMLDGQTGWEHLIAYIPLYRDASTFFGNIGTVYSPTSMIAGHNLGSVHYFRARADLLNDSKYARFMPLQDSKNRLALTPMRPKTEYSFALMAEGLADIIRAGGRGAIGEHGEQPGLGSHWEMWAYAEALTPLEVLKIASLDAAWYIGLDRETGSIETGKLADLVILNSNPLENIRNTADIAWVMKHGRLYDDETLDEIWPDPNPYGPLPWITTDQ